MDFSGIRFSVSRDLSSAGRCPDANETRSPAGERAMCKLVVFKAGGRTCGGSHHSFQP